MRNGILWVSMLAICGAAFSTPVFAVQPPVAGAQAVLHQAAREGKYTFLMFYKQKDAASDAMAKTLKESLAEKAVVAYVQVGNPAERALVATYGVSRAPMPMTIVIAPNGAMTGMFARKVTAATLADAFVTPAMMFTMKNLQEHKLVLVTVQGSANSSTSVAIRDFQRDPHFKNRIAIANVVAADPVEARFIGQMQIDPQTRGTYTVLLAPPGMMVGKFEAAASKDEIAAALAKAGKCCDDPNCKHHQQPPRATTQPKPGAKR